MQERPYFTDRDNPFIKKLEESITSVTKKTSELKGTHGASDVRFYTTMNVPVVEFGPIGSGAHSDNEWIDIQSLEDYYHTLKNFLLSIK